MRRAAWLRPLTSLLVSVGTTVLLVAAVPRYRADVTDSVASDTDDATGIRELAKDLSATPPVPLVLSVLPVVVATTSCPSQQFPGHACVVRDPVPRAPPRLPG